VKPHQCRAVGQSLAGPDAPPWVRLALLANKAAKKEWKGEKINKQRFKRSFWQAATQTTASLD